MRITNKLFFLLLMLLALTVCFYIYSVYMSVPSFSRGNIPVIVVDCGHGSPDGGAVGINGTLEKDINLSIGLKLQEVLENRGAKVIMTRTDDNAIYDSDADTIHEMKVSDMHNRLKIINESNADLFISIHMNAFTNPKSKGLHVFYSANHPEAEAIASKIQTNISAITGAETHEVKTASEKLFLMKDPKPPSVLVECGFISNPEEEKKLVTDEYQSKIAFAIAQAIID